MSEFHKDVLGSRTRADLVPGAGERETHLPSGPGTGRPHQGARTSVGLEEKEHEKQRLETSNDRMIGALETVGARP